MLSFLRFQNDEKEAKKIDNFLIRRGTEQNMFRPSTKDDDKDEIKLERDFVFGMNECNLLVCLSLAPVLKAIISKQNYLAVKKLIYFSLCNPFSVYGN